MIFMKKITHWIKSLTVNNCGLLIEFEYKTRYNIKCLFN